VTAVDDPSGQQPAYDWITPTQAALRLDVTVRDVYRLIDTGVLPAYRIAHEVRLLAHEVERARREGVA
jgi:excisionase family DNA binding protein